MEQNLVQTIRTHISVVVIYVSIVALGLVNVLLLLRLDSKPSFNQQQSPQQLPKPLTNREISQKLNQKFTQKLGIQRSDLSQLIEETKTLIDYADVTQDPETPKKIYSSAGTYFPQIDELLYAAASKHLNIINTGDTKYPLLQKYYNARKNDLSSIESFDFTTTTYDSDLLPYERKYDYLPIEPVDGFATDISKQLNIRGEKYFNTTENKFKFRFNSSKIEDGSNKKIEGGYIHDLYFNPENTSKTLYPTHQEATYSKYHTLIHIPSQDVRANKNDGQPQSSDILCPENPSDQKYSPYICQQTLGFSKLSNYNKVLSADLVSTILATDPLSSPTFTHSTTENFSYIYDTLTSDISPSSINSSAKSRKIIFTFSSINLHLNEIQLEINGKVTEKITLKPTTRLPITDATTVFSKDIGELIQNQIQTAQTNKILPTEVRGTGCQPAIPNSRNFQLDGDRMAFDIQLNDVDITTSNKIVIYVKPDYGNYSMFWDTYAEFLSKRPNINTKYKVIIRYVSSDGDELSGIAKYYYAINCIGQPNLTRAFIKELGILRGTRSAQPSIIPEDKIKNIVKTLLKEKTLNYQEVTYEKFEQILTSTDVANQIMNVNYSNRNIKLSKTTSFPPNSQSQDIHDSAGVVVLNENLQKVTAYSTSEKIGDILDLADKLNGSSPEKKETV